MVTFSQTIDTIFLGEPSRGSYSYALSITLQITNKQLFIYKVISSRAN